MFFPCNTLSFFFFPPGAPFLGRGGVVIFLRCCMLSNTWKPKWGGPVVSQGRETALLGGYGTSVWDFVSGGTFSLEACELSQLVDEHQTSPVQVKPFLLIWKTWLLSSAASSRQGSIASPSPSSPSLGWALGSSNVWDLPFDLRFSLEKSKLFAAWLQPGRSYSPINIFSFVLPRNVIWVIVLPFLLSPAQGNPKPHINHNTGTPILRVRLHPSFGCLPCLLHPISHHVQSSQNYSLPCGNVSLIPPWVGFAGVILHGGHGQILIPLGHLGGSGVSLIHLDRVSVKKHPKAQLCNSEQVCKKKKIIRESWLLFLHSALCLPLNISTHGRAVFPYNTHTHPP